MFNNDKTDETTELQQLEQEKSNIVITDEATVKDYYNLRQQLDTHTKDMRDVIMHPNYCLQFLQPGRLVKVKYKDHDFGWGAVVTFTPRKANKGEILQPQQFLHCGYFASGLE